MADIQGATNIYPEVFGLFKQIYTSHCSGPWLLAVDYRLTQSVAKFLTHIRKLDTHAEIKKKTHGGNWDNKFQNSVTSFFHYDEKHV